MQIPLTGWDPPVGERLESDMARADWSAHVTERGGLSQSRVRLHVGQQIDLFRPIHTSRPRRLTKAPTWAMGGPAWPGGERE